MLFERRYRVRDPDEIWKIKLDPVLFSVAGTTKGSFVEVLREHGWMYAFKRWAVYSGN